MKRRPQLKLSPRQCEMLMAYAANNNLSIDQIAHLKSYSPTLLSRLVNSGKGMYFLEQLSQFPPSILENHIMIANEFPPLILLGMKQKHEKKK